MEGRDEERNTYNVSIIGVTYVCQRNIEKYELAHLVNII